MKSAHLYIPVDDAGAVKLPKRECTRLAGEYLDWDCLRPLAASGCLLRVVEATQNEGQDVTSWYVATEGRNTGEMGWSLTSVVYHPTREEK